MTPSPTAFLRHLIREKGPLPFDVFMNHALHHPAHGFYASEEVRIGKDGDFLTPVSPGPVLGQLLARQADDLHQALGRPKEIKLVEQGADLGSLARDVCSAVHQHHPRLASAAQFHLVEPQPRLAEKQQHTLSSENRREKVRWHDSWKRMPKDDLPCFFYSCELVDSFAVRIFRYRAGTWREQLVGWDESGFGWHEGEVDSGTTAMIRRWSPPEAEGYTVEIRPGVAAWAQSWAEKIPCGLVVTMDYGFSSAELFSPNRGSGTLAAIQGHQKSAHPLANPGQQDLTAHVNFTELENLGSGMGWENYGFTDFARGLTALASPLLRKNVPRPDAWVRNFRHLTHPSFFGHTHKILAQGKGLPASFQPMITGSLP